MTPARRIVVIVNAGSGGGNDQALAERLAGLFEAAGASAEIRLAHGGSEIAAAVESAVAARPDVIVAAGGDGTVSSVSAAVVGTDICLGVLPLGTLNHFAKDLGLPLELEAAVRCVVGGVPDRVDVGEVNGRVFVNNSGLGLYPDIVRDREQQQKRFGRGKWHSLLRASVAALRRYPFLRVSLVVDGHKREYGTPFVFIGNNDYRVDGLAMGQRSGIADGVLSLYVAQRPGRLRLVQLAVFAFLGRLRETRDFEQVHATEIGIESRHRRLRVSTDGEVTDMAPPLRYRIRPASLRVLRDSAGAAASPPGSATHT